MDFVFSNKRLALVVLLIPLALVAYRFFSTAIDKFLSSTLPNQLTLHLKSDDPYINSFFSDKKTKSEISRTKKIIKGFLSYIFLLVFIVLIFSILNSSSLEVKTVINNEFSENGQSEIDFGPFGDLFNGILTPLLTFSSFLFLLFTVVLQNIQMRATLSELQLSRLEMSESTDALQAQAKNLNAQKFDNIFFSLVENYKILLKDLREQKFLNEFGDEIKESYESYTFNKINNLHYSKLEFYWDNVKDDFLSIFLLNYQMLKYIDTNVDSCITKLDARRYIGIIRAITPKNILFLIYVNCGLSDFEKYKNLLEKFSFFEHLYFTGVNINVFKKISSKYKIKAFGDAQRIYSYIDLNFNSMSFFYEPINNFKNNIKSYDVSFLSDDEIISFYDYGQHLEDGMQKIFNNEIISKKDEVLRKFISSNEDFVKFCTNDISVMIDYKRTMDALLIENKNKFSEEYERLRKCHQ